MEALLRKFRVDRHYMVVDEGDLIEILKVVTNTSSWFINQQIKVDNGVLVRMKYETKCAIEFSVSDEQWSSIISELKDKGYILLVDDYDIIVVSKK